MTQLKELGGTFTAAENVPAFAAAGTDGNIPVWQPQFNATVTGITFIPSAAVTADGTNYTVYTVTNKGSGSGSTSVATRSWAATNSVASTPEAMTLSGTAANLNVTAGDNIEVVKTHGGTGLAVAVGRIVITYKRR